MAKHSIHYVLSLDDEVVLLRDFNFEGVEGTKKVNIKGNEIASHFAKQGSITFQCTLFLRSENENVEVKYLNVFTKGRPVLGNLIYYGSEEPRVHTQFQGVLDYLNFVGVVGEYLAYKLVIKINQIRHN